MRFVIQLTKCYLFKSHSHVLQILNARNSKNARAQSVVKFCYYFPIFSYFDSNVVFHWTNVWKRFILFLMFKQVEIYITANQMQGCYFWHPRWNPASLLKHKQFSKTAHFSDQKISSTWYKKASWKRTLKNAHYFSEYLLKLIISHQNIKSNPMWPKNKFLNNDNL